MIGLFVRISADFILFLDYLYGLLYHFLLFGFMRVQGEVQASYRTDGLRSQQLGSRRGLGADSLGYDLGYRVGIRPNRR